MLFDGFGDIFAGTFGTHEAVISDDRGEWSLPVIFSEADARTDHDGVPFEEPQTVARIARDHAPRDGIRNGSTLTLDDGREYQVFSSEYDGRAMTRCILREV